ncbi:MAG: dihydroneopterin aldolase [Rikenellaceae bacterium]
MEYKINLQQMEFRAFHGCYELERIVGNRFAVDLEICTELGDVATSDDVTKSVNYLIVYEIVREQMTITRHTIEAVAVQIIEAIKGEFPQIISVECRVAKIAPPLGGKVAQASVTIKR